MNEKKIDKINKAVLLLACGIMIYNIGYAKGSNSILKYLRKGNVEIKL